MRLFVSYSRRDATAAGQLIADLEKASLSAWHDHELHGGDPWWQDILQQIRNCDVFVLALPDNEPFPVAGGWQVGADTPTSAR